MQCGRSSRSLLLKRNLISPDILHQTVTFIRCLPANRKSTESVNNLSLLIGARIDNGITAETSGLHGGTYDEGRAYTHSPHTGQSRNPEFSVVSSDTDR